MTTTLIEMQQRLDELGVAYRPSTSLHRGGYAYRVLIADRYIHIKKRTGTHLSVTRRREKVLGDLDRFVQQVHDLLQQHEQRDEMAQHAEYMTSNGVGKCSRLGTSGYVYFENPRDLVDFCEKWPDRLDYASGPCSDQHETALHETRKRKTIIRQKLFKGKFRYRLQYSLTREFHADQYPILMKKLNKMPPGSWGQYGLDARTINYRLGSGWTGYRPRVTLFLQDEEDFVMIKMMTSEHVCKSDEIILVDEMK